MPQHSAARITNFHASLDTDPPFAQNALRHQLACALDGLTPGSLEIVEKGPIRVTDQSTAVPYVQKEPGTSSGLSAHELGCQREAIEAFAKYAGYELVETFYDAAVSGADPIEHTTRLP